MGDFAFPPKPKPKAAPPTPEDGHEALVRIRPRLAAVDISRTSVNIEVPRAVATALGAVAKIQALRPDIVKHLPLLPIAQIDDIPDLATALWYAHASLAKLSRADKERAALTAEAGPLREELLVSAELLARRGLVDAARVAHIRSGQGAHDQATDLTALSVLFRQAWPEVKNKTAVTQEEVERADVLGRKLLAGLGKKTPHARRAKPMDPTHEEQKRCFVLFTEAYDWARRAATYLRWRERDADILVPSLYRRTRRIARKAAEPTDTTPVPAKSKAPRRRPAKR